LPKIRHIDGMVSKRQILSGVLVAFLGGTVWLAIPPDEPVYQGKSLTAWLQQCVDNPMLEYGNENPPPNYRSEQAKRDPARTEGEIAIRHIGTNALPYLLKMAAAQDSPFKKWLTALLRKQSFIAIPYRIAMEDHEMALCGFVNLESSATPAVPDLVKLLYVQPTTMEADVAQNAGNCLTFIGPAAVPDLLPLLTNRDEDVRHYAAYPLSSIAFRLAYLVGTDQNETNRQQYVFELAAIGSKDLDVAKALANALKDKSLLVRSAATNALMKINPEAAAKAGVK
jgi:hypothetical protein